jgi:hypothetical protein
MERLERLYNLFLRNIQLHRPTATKPLCPICLREMSLGGDDNSRVTEGHVYPQATGIDGGTVVECGRCNHTLGTMCDEDFVQQLRVDRYRAGERSVEVFRGLIGHAGANLKIDDQPATARVGGVGSNPHLHFHVSAPLRIDDNGNIEFRFEFRAPDFRVSLAGVLHAAYLRMFYLLGYEYVFNPNVESIRSDLNRLASGKIPRDRIAQEFAPYRTLMFQRELMENWRFAHVVASPPGCRSFLAIVRTLPERCVAVFLPGFGKEGRKAYQRLLRTRSRRIARGTFEICSLELSELSREERLSDPQLKNFGDGLWTQAGSHRSSLRKAMRKQANG